MLMFHVLAIDLIATAAVSMHVDANGVIVD